MAGIQPYRYPEGTYMPGDSRAANLALAYRYPVSNMAAGIRQQFWHPEASLPGPQATNNMAVPAQPYSTGAMNYYYPRLEIGTTEPVLITQVLAPHCFSCQLRSMVHEAQRLLDSMQHYYQVQKGYGEQVPQPALAAGQPCASMGADGRWYRSLLQGIFPDKPLATVVHVDWGGREIVPLSGLRYLAEEFLRLPVVTFPCALYGIANGGLDWEQRLVAEFCTLLHGKQVNAKIECFNSFERLYFVTLFAEDGTDLNHHFKTRSQNPTITMPGVTGPPKDDGKEIPSEQTPQSDSYVSKFPPVELKTSKFYDAEVVFVIDPFRFWVRLKMYAAEHKEMVDGMTTLYSQASKLEGIISAPKPGQLCCAMYEDLYCRAEVISIDERKQVKVYFLDKGILETVDWYNIKELPTKFTKLQALAVKCCIADTYPLEDAWSQEASRAFKIAVTDRHLVIHVILKDADEYTIDIQDQSRIEERCIGKILANAGLARFEELDSVDGQSNSEKIALIESTKAVLRPSATDYIPKIQEEAAASYPCEENTETLQFSPFEDQLFEPGTTIEVVVSYIENPGFFWCQNARSRADLCTLMDAIQKQCTSTNCPYTSDTLACLAKSLKDDVWYRAFINEIPVNISKTTTVDVLYVDYGIRENVPLTNLRALNGEFFHLKAQAFKCSLYNIITPKGNNPFTWDNEATKVFSQFVQKASKWTEFHCIFYATASLDNEVFNIVDLYTPFASVCDELVQSGYATHLHHKTLASSVQLLTYYHSKHDLKLGDKEEIYITYVDSPLLFYLQLARSSNTIDRISATITKVIDKTPKIKLLPKCGSLCLAKFSDQHWYRGMQSEDGSNKIFFVDYGNTEKLSKDCILPIMSSEHSILLVPVQAIKCSLSDIPSDVPGRIVSWFKNAVLDKPLKALFVAKDADGKLSIDLFDGDQKINETLKSKLGLRVQKEKNDYPPPARPTTAKQEDSRKPPDNTGNQEKKTSFTLEKSIKSREFDVRSHSDRRGSDSRSHSDMRGSSSQSHSVTRGSDSRSHSITRGSDSRSHSDTRGSDGRSHSDTRGSDSRSHSITRGSDSRSHSDTRGFDSRSHSITRGSDSRSHSDTRGSDSRSHSDTRGSDNRSHSDTRGSDSRSHSDTRGSDNRSHSDTRGFDSRSHSDRRGSDSRSHSDRRGSDSRSHSDTRGSDSRSHSDTRGSDSRSHSDTRGSDSRSHSDTRGSDSRSHSDTRGSDSRSHSDRRGSDSRSHTDTRGSDNRSHSDTRGSDSRSHSDTRGSDSRSHSDTRGSDSRSHSDTRGSDSRSHSVQEPETIYKKNPTFPYKAENKDSNSRFQESSFQRKTETIQRFPPSGSCQGNFSGRDFKQGANKSLPQRQSSTLATEQPSPAKPPVVVTLSDIPQRKIVHGMKEAVYVSHINSVFDFYVQVAEDGKLDEMSEILNNKNDLLEELRDEDISPGNVICAYFPDDGQYYRGVVTGKSRQGLCIQYIDYGNTSVTSDCKNYSLPQKCRSFPAMSIYCSLDKPNSASSSPNLMEALTKFSERTSDVRLECQFLKQDGQKWEVILKDELGCLNDLLCAPEEPVDEEKVTKIVKEAENPYISAFSWNLPQPGATVKVYASAVDGPECFWCQLSTADIESLASQVQEAGEKSVRGNDFISALQVGSLCNVIFSEDNNWYRAMVTKMEADVVTVRFIDYGNEDSVGQDQLRQLPEHLVKISPQAFSCCLADSDMKAGTWTSEGRNYFYEKVTEDVLELTICEIQEGDKSQIPVARVTIKCNGLDINEEVRKFLQGAKNEDLKVPDESMKSSPVDENQEMDQPQDNGDSLTTDVRSNEPEESALEDQCNVIEDNTCSHLKEEQQSDTDGVKGVISLLTEAVELHQKAHHDLAVEDLNQAALKDHVPQEEFEITPESRMTIVPGGSEDCTEFEEFEDCSEGPCEENNGTTDDMSPGQVPREQGGSIESDHPEPAAYQQCPDLMSSRQQELLSRDTSASLESLIIYFNDKFTLLNEESTSHDAATKEVTTESEDANVPEAESVEEFVDCTEDGARQENEGDDVPSEDYVDIEDSLGSEALEAGHFAESDDLHRAEWPVPSIMSQEDKIIETIKDADEMVPSVIRDDVHNIENIVTSEDVEATDAMLDIEGNEDYKEDSAGENVTDDDIVDSPVSAELVDIDPEKDAAIKEEESYGGLVIREEDLVPEIPLDSESVTEGEEGREDCMDIEAVCAEDLSLRDETVTGEVTTEYVRTRTSNDFIQSEEDLTSCDVIECGAATTTRTEDIQEDEEVVSTGGAVGGARLSVQKFEDILVEGPSIDFSQKCVTGVGEEPADDKDIDVKDGMNRKEPGAGGDLELEDGMDHEEPIDGKNKELKDNMNHEEAVTSEDKELMIYEEAVTGEDKELMIYEEAVTGEDKELMIYEEAVTSEDKELMIYEEAVTGEDKELMIYEEAVTGEDKELKYSMKSEEGAACEEVEEVVSFGEVFCTSTDFKDLEEPETIQGFGLTVEDDRSQDVEHLGTVTSKDFVQSKGELTGSDISECGAATNTDITEIIEDDEELVSTEQTIGEVGSSDPELAEEVMESSQHSADCVRGDPSEDTRAPERVQGQAPAEFTAENVLEPTSEDVTSEGHDGTKEEKEEYEGDDVPSEDYVDIEDSQGSEALEAGHFAESDDLHRAEWPVPSIMSQEDKIIGTIKDADEMVPSVIRDDVHNIENIVTSEDVEATEAMLDIEGNEEYKEDSAGEDVTNDDIVDSPVSAELVDIDPEKDAAIKEEGSYGGLVISEEDLVPEIPLDSESVTEGEEGCEDCMDIEAVCAEDLSLKDETVTGEVTTEYVRTRTSNDFIQSEEDLTSCDVIECGAATTTHTEDIEEEIQEDGEVVSTGGAVGGARLSVQKLEAILVEGPSIDLSQKCVAGGGGEPADDKDIDGMNRKEPGAGGDLELEDSMDHEEPIDGKNKELKDNMNYEEAVTGEDKELKCSMKSEEGAACEELEDDMNRKEPGADGDLEPEDSMDHEEPIDGKNKELKDNMNHKEAVTGEDKELMIYEEAETGADEELMIYEEAVTGEDEELRYSMKSEEGAACEEVEEVVAFGGVFCTSADFKDLEEPETIQGFGLTVEDDSSQDVDHLGTVTSKDLVPSKGELTGSDISECGAATNTDITEIIEEDEELVSTEQTIGEVGSSFEEFEATVVEGQNFDLSPDFVAGAGERLKDLEFKDSMKSDEEVVAGDDTEIGAPGLEEILWESLSSGDISVHELAEEVMESSRHSVDCVRGDPSEDILPADDTNTRPPEREQEQAPAEVTAEDRLEPTSEDVTPEGQESQSGSFTMYRESPLLIASTESELSDPLDEIDSDSDSEAPDAPDSVEIEVCPDPGERRMSRAP